MVACYAAVDSWNKDGELDFGNVFGESGDVLKAVRNSGLWLRRACWALEFPYVLLSSYLPQIVCGHNHRAISHSLFLLILTITP